MVSASQPLPPPNSPVMPPSLASRPRKPPRRPPAPTHSPALSAALEELTDTLAALHYVRSLIPANFPPVVHVCSLYGVLVGRESQVDEDLGEMEVRGVIRRFVSATDRGEDSVILAQDYQTLLTSAREGAAGHSEANEVDEVMWNAFTTLVSSTRAEALSGPSLESAGLNVEAQKELVRRGFLTVSGARSYRISVPSLGLVAGAVSRGRDEILRVLRRRPNREIAEQQLALKLSRLLGNGSLPLRYHLSSLRGLGWVDVVHAPMDDLVRLTSKGSRRAERTAAPKYELKPKKSVTQVIEEGRQRLGLA